MKTKRWEEILLAVKEKQRKRKAMLAKRGRDAFKYRGKRV